MGRPLVPGADELAVIVLGESTAAGVGVRTQDEGLAPAIAEGLARHTGRSVRWHVVAHRVHRRSGADRPRAAAARRTG